MKQLFTAATVLVLSLFVCSNSFAQKTASLSTINNTEDANLYELHSKESSQKTIPTSSAEIARTRALKHFNNLFPTATEVSWFGSDNLFSATFLQEGVRTRITYNRKGYWIRTFIYYTGDKLLSTVSTLISDNYPDYVILGVNEIHESDKTMYIVNIASINKIKQLLVCNDLVSVYQEFERSK